MRLKLFLSFFSVIVVCWLQVTSDLWAQPASDKKPLAALIELSNSFRSLSERVSPAIVQIIATGIAPVQGNDPSSVGLVVAQRSAGSGVILDPEGYIITNAHVVEGARQIQVLLALHPDEKSQWLSVLKPRGKTVPGQIVGIDRETDLAVIKVEEKRLTPMEFGDSDKLKQGQLVLAFGSPLGLENSVTMGVVSSPARQLRPEDPMIYIQTDAPINPGNSGGPLVDAEGRLIGINTFILTQSGGSEGIGFAAPSSIVRNVFNQIRSHGRVHRGIIGVSVVTVTNTLAAGLKLSQSWGVLAQDVLPKGPAAMAGLQIGDLILNLDGKTMENARQFDVNLYQRPIGEVVTLEVLRGEGKLTLKVSVTQRPDDPHRFVDRVLQESNFIPQLGVFAIDLDDAIAGLLPPLRRESGVVVAAKAAQTATPAELFLPGDVIYSVNTEPVKDLAALKKSLGNLKIGGPVVLQIERFGQLMYIAFEMP